MKEVAELLNGMREAGVVTDYALFGAAAQMRSWPEKIRQAERLRSSIEAIRKERRRQLRRDLPGSRNDEQAVLT